MTSFTLTAFLLLLACSDKSAPNNSAVTTASGSVERVISSDPSGWSDSAHAWHLVLERTIEPKEDAADAFRNVRQILLRENGGVIVLDRKPPAITWYLPNGTSRPIGREGDGPGEYRQPIAALVGDTLVFLDWTQHRVTIMRLSGEVIRSIPVPKVMVGPPITIERSGVFRLTTMRDNVKHFETEWVRMSPEGQAIDSMDPPVAVPERMWVVLSPSGEMDSSIPLAPGTQFGFLPDGNVIYGRTDRDEFIVTHTGKDTLRIFGRSGTLPLPLSSHERDSLFDMFVPGDTDLVKVAKRSDIPSVRPLWASLFIDGRGNVWVLRDPLHISDPARWDIYNPKGHWLGELTAPFPPTWSGLSFVGDRVAIQDEDAAGAQRVRVYRIVR